MLRLLSLIAQATLISLVAYNTLTALWGWPNRPPATKGERDRRLLVVIPAHNEARVIANVVSDVLKSDYPSALVDVWVIADRCTDSTADVATRSGARVAERVDGETGKGHAISWFIEHHPPNEKDVLLVFDADNRVPPHAVARIVDEIEQGAGAVQCYLDSVDPTGSLVAEASALSYWAGNRMVQLARANLGWSADLGGTGMAFTLPALVAAGGFSHSLTEDQDLGVRLVLTGTNVLWLHDVRIADEKPRTLGVAIRQRARWMAGKRQVRRLHLGALLSRPTPGRVDLALRLVQPGRSFVALISALLAISSWLTGSTWLLPWGWWAVATAVQVLQPIPYLARDGVEPRMLARYPLIALIAALWIPVRIMSTVVRGWFHTPHVGINGDVEGESGP